MDKPSRLASELWPYLLPRIEALVSLGVEGSGSGGSIVAGAPTPHALNSTHHSGILADSQGPQFLKLDGSRALAGNLSADPGITIDGADISAHVADPDAHHARATAGDGIDVTGQQIAVDVTDILGAGLTESANNIVVGAGNGITVNANDVAVNQGYAFAWTANHTHAGNVTFTGAARTITSDGGYNLTLGAGGDLVLDPTGNVQVPNAQELRTTSFSDLVTGITGMRLWDIASNYRALTLGYLKADELHVRVFVADETRVDRGEEYWTKSFGIVQTDFTTPADEATVDVWFENSPAVSGRIFTNGDWLLARVIDWGIGLTVTKHWFQVAADWLSDDTANRRQQWRLRLKSGTTGVVIKAGAVLVDVGQTGDGWVHINAYKNSGGPYLQLGDWSGSDPSVGGAFTNRVRLGNLNGVGGISSDTWGFAAAANLATSIGSGFEGIVVDPTNGVRLYNSTLNLYDGATQTVWLDPTNGLTVRANSTGVAGPYEVVNIALWDEKRSVSFWDATNRFANLAATKYTTPTPDEYGVTLDCITPGTGALRAAVRVSAVSSGATVTGTNPILFLEHSNSINRATLAADVVRLMGREFWVIGDEGQDAILNLWADEGDDNEDKWRLRIVNGSGGVRELYLQGNVGGTWNTYLKLDDLDGVSTPQRVTTPRVEAYDSNGVVFYDDGGNEAAKVLDGGAFQVTGLFILEKQTTTISSGAITATASDIYLSGEGGAADDLDTINGGVEGAVVVLHNSPGGYTITVKHNTGNLRLSGSADFGMDGRSDTITLIYRSTGLTGWMEVSRSNNG